MFFAEPVVFDEPVDFGATAFVGDGVAVAETGGAFAAG